MSINSTLESLWKPCYNYLFGVAIDYLLLVTLSFSSFFCNRLDLTISKLRELKVDHLFFDSDQLCCSKASLYPRIHIISVSSYLFCYVITEFRPVFLMNDVWIANYRVAFLVSMIATHLSLLVSNDYLSLLGWRVYCFLNNRPYSTKRTI